MWARAETLLHDPARLEGEGGSIRGRVARRVNIFTLVDARGERENNREFQGSFGISTTYSPHFPATGYFFFFV